jgi:MSHA biogenesis protein MshJ
MADVLRQVLREQRQLQLLDLRNEAPTPIFASTQTPDKTADKNRPAIYQHGLTLRLKGRYFEVVNYLHTLENLPWHFYWQHFEYKVGTYPEAEVTVTVYTLSNRESWIGA